jgi:hypothetical protein
MLRELAVVQDQLRARMIAALKQPVTALMSVLVTSLTRKIPK